MEKKDIMLKYKVFISSVQSEFAQERQRIFDFIRTDELIGQHFEPFIFEQIAAQDTNPRQLYIDEASSCQVYLLLEQYHLMRQTYNQPKYNMDYLLHLYRTNKYHQYEYD